jgi:elongation factor 1-alpha
MQLKIDRRTKKVEEELPQFVKTGNSPLVEIVPTKQMVVELFTEYPPLEMFAVREMKSTVGVCVIPSVRKKKKERKGMKAKKKRLKDKGRVGRSRNWEENMVVDGLWKKSLEKVTCLFSIRIFLFISHISLKGCFLSFFI